MTEEKKQKSLTFQVSCEQEFYDRLNHYCEKTGTNRSKLTRIALEKELLEREMQELK